MKKILLSFLLLGVTGCSYSLKTSLIQEPIGETKGLPQWQLEDCNESEYCDLSVFAQMNDFEDLEAYEKKHGVLDPQWSAYVQTKLNYKAMVPGDCDALLEEKWQQRCDLAVRFNQSPIDCSLEDNAMACYEQKMYSEPSVDTCNEKIGEKKASCIISTAVMTNSGHLCKLLDADDVGLCRSFVANSLYFCEDKACVDYYFKRNITESPRLTYCRFEDETLHGYCQDQIKNWFALSHDNFLYCSTKECYKLLIEKTLVHKPEMTLEQVQERSCQHLSVQKSNERCASFAADTYAQAKGSIGACDSFLCFESFKGNIAVDNISDCTRFESQLLEGEDVFGEREELSMCLAVVDYNKALKEADEDLCTTTDCVDAVEYELNKTITPDMSAEDIKKTLEEVDVEQALKNVNLNDVANSIDVNKFRNVVDPEGQLDGVDLNESLKNIDLNEELKKINIKELLNQLDVEALVETK